MEDKLITTSEIIQKIHNGLIARGYVPTSDELFDLGDIFFDYLVDLHIIEVIPDVTELEEQ